MYLKGGENMTNYDAEMFAVEVDIIVSNLAETLKRKNADYGNNVDKGIDKRGLGSLVQRLEDKLARFENLAEKGNPQLVLDEAVEDTLLDLAGYAILGYRKIQEMKGMEVGESLNEIPLVYATVTPTEPIKRSFTFND